MKQIMISALISAVFTASAVLIAHALATTATPYRQDRVAPIPFRTVVIHPEPMNGAVLDLSEMCNPYEKRPCLFVCNHGAKMPGVQICGADHLWDDCHSAVASESAAANSGIGLYCNDGIDNDCDGLVDHDDPDCMSLKHPLSL